MKNIVGIAANYSIQAGLMHNIVHPHAGAWGTEQKLTPIYTTEPC
jgi:hypothetical protein